MTQADTVELALAAVETTETELGTMTVPTVGVKRIVGVSGVITIGTATAAEGTAGKYRLSFTSVPGTYTFPATINYGPAGTLADSGHQFQPAFIPVDIPVPPNEKVTAHATLDLAQTGACRGRVSLIYE